MTMNEGVLLDKIPRLYYSDGEIEPFLRAIETKIDTLEKFIDEIPNLVDVDSCKDSALPYLAATINCPLFGQNPALWRKQIKNWPYICRMKGTKKGLLYFFDSLGLITEKLETYWRSGDGSYTVERPVGIPYLSDGLWNNSKTHYFGLELSFGDKHTLDDEDPYMMKLREKLAYWIGWVKPAHAELLKAILKKYLQDKKINFNVGIAKVNTSITSTNIEIPNSNIHQGLGIGFAQFISGESIAMPNYIGKMDLDFAYGIAYTLGSCSTVHIDPNEIIPNFERDEYWLGIKIGFAEQRCSNIIIAPNFPDKLNAPYSVGIACMMSTSEKILPNMVSEENIKYNIGLAIMQASISKVYPEEDVENG